MLNSVESLIHHCPTIYKEFIVVDNASQQIEKDILERWRIENEDIKFNIIFSDDNLGFARGNNIGASQANGEYLFFLNPDTLVLNDVLSIFIDFMEKSSAGVSAIGGNLFQADLKPNYTYGNFPSVALELCNVGLGLSPMLGKYYKNKLAIGCKVSSKDIFEVSYIIGAALFMRLSTFKLVNGFDDQYFMYYEETDLFRKFQAMGLKSYIIPKAEIIHYEGASIGKSDAKNFNYQKFEVALKSKFYYYKKWRASSLQLIRIIVLFQIIVQYLKGKWGNDLRRLLLIYSQCKA